MKGRLFGIAAALGTALDISVAFNAAAVDIPVAPGESLQSAIASARDGDVVRLGAGTYIEDIDFLGKGISVVGSGPNTILRGTGMTSVVRIASGEGPATMLDSLVVTGGVAQNGGGIHIAGASPTIRRVVVFDNRARSRGSGIYVEGSSALIENSVVLYNRTALGDPHSIEVVNASPTIINNTIARNDSNGLILRGTSPALLMNNLIFANGSDGRGRGICDFSGGTARIHYNLFWRNRVAALLTNGTDFRMLRRAELVIGAPRLVGNVDGRPELVDPRLPVVGSRGYAATTLNELLLDLVPDQAPRRLRLTDAGNPDPVYADLDGSRNDMGFTGGPNAPIW